MSQQYTPEELQTLVDKTIASARECAVAIMDTIADRGFDDATARCALFAVFGEMCVDLDPQLMDFNAEMADAVRKGARLIVEPSGENRVRTRMEGSDT